MMSSISSSISTGQDSTQAAAAAAPLTATAAPGEAAAWERSVTEPLPDGYCFRVNGRQFGPDTILAGSLKRTLSDGAEAPVPDRLELRIFLDYAAESADQGGGTEPSHTEESISACLSSLFPISAPLTLYRDGTAAGLFYINSLSCSGKNVLLLTCTDALGLLAQRTHYGGIYSGSLFSALLADIIGDRFPFTVDEDLGGTRIFGWLPVATRLQNLRQAMLAVGAYALPDPSGTVRFALPDAAPETALPPDRAFWGQTLLSTPSVAVIRLTEHAYATGGGSSTTLYRGTVPSQSFIAPSGTRRTGALILFSAPMHSLSCTGSAILESDANYAVLSPGEECVLYGIPYTHQKRIVTVYNEDAVSDSEISYNSFTLVSTLNSDAVAERLRLRHGLTGILKGDFLPQDTRPGDHITVPTEFSFPFSGLITEEKQDLRQGGRATLTVRTSPIAPPGGNTYQHLTVMGENGTFTVPAGVTRLRAVLIGGGCGGDGGKTGENGRGDTASATLFAGITLTGEAGAGGAGGIGGSGGQGGKIHICTLDVTPGQTFSCSLGAPGTGADADQTGEAGSETAFGSYTSADGERSAEGYLDAIEGILYGAPGQHGAAGGKGGSGGEAVDAAGSIPVGEAGEAADNVSGGLSFAGVTDSYNGFGTSGAGAGGGGGGAGGEIAAHLLHGKQGTVAFSYSDGYLYNTVSGGDGGVGAPGRHGLSASRYGCGGDGGCGGGGGGGGGGYAYHPIQGTARPVRHIYKRGTGGIGGAGGHGGSGCGGCVLIYY